MARVLERMPIMRPRAAGFLRIDREFFALMFVQHCNAIITTFYGQ